MSDKKPPPTEVTIEGQTFKIGDRMCGNPEKKVTVCGTLEKIGKNKLEVKVGLASYYLTRAEIDVELSKHTPQGLLFSGLKLKKRKK